MHDTQSIPCLRRLEVQDLDPGTIPPGALLSIHSSFYSHQNSRDLHAIFLGYGSKEMEYMGDQFEMATVLIGDREMTLCYFNDGRGSPWSLWDNVAKRAHGAFKCVVYHLEDPIHFAELGKAHV